MADLEGAGLFTWHELHRETTVRHQCVQVYEYAAYGKGKFGQRVTNWYFTTNDWPLPIERSRLWLHLDSRLHATEYVIDNGHLFLNVGVGFNKQGLATESDYYKYSTLTA